MAYFSWCWVLGQKTPWMLSISDFRSPSGFRGTQGTDTYCAFHVPVQTNFRLYYFYFLPDQALTRLDHWKVLDKLWCKLSFNPTTGKEFPQRPPLKKLPAFGSVVTLPKDGNFYNGGLWGNSLTENLFAVASETHTRKIFSGSIDIFENTKSCSWGF